MRTSLTKHWFPWTHIWRKRSMVPLQLYTSFKTKQTKETQHHQLWPLYTRAKVGLLWESLEPPKEAYVVNVSTSSQPQTSSSVMHFLDLAFRHICFAFIQRFAKIFLHLLLKYVINIHIWSGYNSDEIEVLSLLFHHSLHGYSIASSGMKFHRKWPSTHLSKMKLYIMLYDFQDQTLSKL
jgi:hypothetical protein